MLHKNKHEIGCQQNHFAGCEWNKKKICYEIETIFIYGTASRVMDYTRIARHLQATKC